MGLETVELPAAADFHVHLRDGAMSAAVTPLVRAGGVNTAYVMPNLDPPVTTVEAALAYRARLRALAPDVDFLMTLYLHATTTPDLVRQAAAAGIAGIKAYPAGVTTNSVAGVLSWEVFYPVFAAMEETGLVLNLHGELPSTGARGDADADGGAGPVTVLSAESRFLPTLAELHRRFPRLPIVLEHCTTEDAVEAVRACGDNVVATITAHHLFLTVDDWAGDVFSYCKPVAKLPKDRVALIRALVGSNGKFFLGSDSAPHDIGAKKGPGKAAAGVFTQPYVCQLVLTALDEAVARGDINEDDITKEALEGFLGGYGRKFYGVEDSSGQRIRLSRGPVPIAESIKGDGVEVVPFRSGRETWGLEWI